MTRRNEEHMAITERELDAMTDQMVEMHEATFPLAQQEIADLGADLRARGAGLHVNRRSLVIAGGAGIGALVLAACGSSKKSSGSTGATSSTAPAGSSGGSGASGDAAALTVDASLENLAVFAYGAALTAAGKGTYGTVPPSLANFATHAKDQHAAHGKAFNAALTGMGGTAYDKPDPALAEAITAMFTKATTFADVAKLALVLENTAGQTYTKQASELDDKTGLGAVATIAPIEQQHAAILNFVLGNYPVPVTFVASDLARPSTDVPSS